MAIAPYYLKTAYTLEAKNEVFGLRITLNIFEFHKLALEGGFKKYYSILYNPIIPYENTFFTRVSYLFLPYIINGNWFGLSLYFDKTFYTSKIGVIGNVSNFPYIIEFSFYPYLNITMGFTYIFKM